MKTQLLAKVLLSFAFTFSIVGLHAQIDVSGTVVDAKTGEPLISATVLAENTSTGAVTDLEGNFKLKVPEETTHLQFSYTGYQTKRVEIGNQREFNVELESEELLEEVIVIGYSTQKKSDKTGAVSNVSEEELIKGRLSDPIQSIQGKVAGVNVSKQGGDPNAGFSVNIRGAASLTAGTGPLYVIDGVPGVDPTTINPDDIESFNILKDASSTAIYGARGSNGVVIITTKGSSFKKRSEPTSSVEYNGFVSVDQVAQRYDLLDAGQVRTFAEESGRSFIDNGANTDWQDEVYRTGVSQLHTLAFNGANQKTTYRASLSYNDIQGVLEGSGKTRLIGRLNLSQKAFNDRLTVSGRLSATLEENDYITYGGGFAPNNVIYQMLRRSPTDPVRNEDGSFFETDRSFQYFNPVAIIEDYQNERDAKRYLGNFRADLEIIDGLMASVNLAYIRDDSESFYHEPSFTFSNTTEGLARRSYNNYENQLIETTLSYVKDLRGGHFLNVIGGHSYQIENWDGFSAQAKQSFSDLVTSNNLGAYALIENSGITSYKSQALLASFFGRVVYDFKKKYYFTATVRRDGSSKFGENNEWGLFPSASVGWDLTKENFMSGADFLSQLKLRVGYGTSGNQNIPLYIDEIYYVPGGTAINPETGETVIVFNNNTNANPDLKWEENRELNVGIDFGIFDDRVSGSLEYYRKTTVDLIYDYSVPKPPNRFERTFANVGEIENNGFEATIQAFVLDLPKLKYKTVLTFTKNSQKTVSLSNDQYELVELRTMNISNRGSVSDNNRVQVIRPGLEIGTFYLPEYAGLSDDGAFLYFTEAGGVTRDITAAELRVLGSAQPDFILGWSNYIDIGKGFDVSFAFRAVVGHDVFNATRMAFSNPGDLPTLNTLEEALDEFDRGVNSSPVPSSYYLEDASFLKLDNLNIGYTFSNFDTKFLKNLRLYFSGTNLLVITGYTGIDPEVSYGGVEFGRDQFDVYPQTRSFTFGLNATF